MSFRKIDYLAWARTFMGHSRYDLARSNMKAATREDLGLGPDTGDLAPAADQGNDELRTLIARRYGVPPARVLITGGATMGIFLSCAATLDRADEVLLESPNYEPLYRIPLKLGASVKAIDRRFENGWQIDLEQLERRASRATRAIIMTNTHNPSGVATSNEKMQTIGQIARSCGARVIVSEVYLDNAFAPDLRPAATCGDHMISLGSMSKVYGLGTLRVGWMVAPEEVVERARGICDYIGGYMPGPTQAIALAALRKSDVLAARCRDLVQRNIAIATEWLQKHDTVRWVPPDGGTICLLKLPPRIDAIELSALLREKCGTLVVPGDFFWVRGFIRVSLGIDEDVLRAGLKNIGAAIEQLTSPKRR